MIERKKELEVTTPLLWQYQPIALFNLKIDKYSFNTSYLTDSRIVFTLKMESVSKMTIFLSKNDGEKWSRKNLFEIPPCGSHFLLIHFTTEK